MKRTGRIAVAVVLAVVSWVIIIGGITFVMSAIADLDSALATDPFQVILFFATGAVAVGFGIGGLHITDRLCSPLPTTPVCPNCEYDLRGQTEAGCPECGWERGDT